MYNLKRSSNVFIMLSEIISMHYPLMDQKLYRQIWIDPNRRKYQKNNIKIFRSRTIRYI